MKSCFFRSLIALPLFFAQIVLGQTPSSPRIAPEQIEQELEDAEGQYEQALKLFNPWYTGPLITPSATMVPPGHAMWQPYIYFTDNYSTFNKERKSVNTPNTFFIKAQPVILQIGATPSVDLGVVMSTVAQWKQGRFSGGFQDMTVQIGFLISQQTPYAPQIKFTLGEVFPTGNYQNLDGNNLGLDGTGGGSWTTAFNLTLAKLFFWNTLHPLNTRISFGYTVPTPTTVHGFNSYGGGYGTKGTVAPGNNFNVDLGMELSINQPWVVALDVAYTCSGKTRFSGISGTTTPGGDVPASVGGGYSDQLSFAPAVEYNFSSTMGLLGGVWFSAYGRNAPNFVSAVFTWYWFFP